MPGVEAGHAPASVLELGVCEPHPVYGTGSVAEPRKATLDGFRVWASKLGVAGFRVWASKLSEDSFQVWASKPGLAGFRVWASKLGVDGFPVWASKPGVGPKGRSTRGGTERLALRRSYR